MIANILKWDGLLLAHGRYQIQSKLGEGGMAFVYRARQCNLNKDVVIKVPRPALLQELGFAERFRREVQTLVKLEHPHIVRIVDVDEHEGIPFAVMAYLAGGVWRTVNHAIRLAGHFPPNLPASANGWNRSRQHSISYTRRASSTAT
jgi:serine/threonine protein kinase